MAMIPRTEYNNLRSEVRALQQQQKVISTVLNQIRRQNDQLYQQATAFQTLHDRHENSINAILTFLATFYNRSLETNQGMGSFAEMFAPQMPQQQPHGSVVDVGDFPEKVFQQSPQPNRQPRRPLALLPAPVAKADATLSPSDRAATLSPSVRSAVGSPVTKPAPRPTGLRSSAAPPTTASQTPTAFRNRPVRDEAFTAPPKVDVTSPPQPFNALPQDDIMSVIQNANANQPTRQSPQDFSAALSNYETQGGNVPLTQQQRNDVLSLMANNTSAAAPNSTIAHNTNNALINPQPPTMPSLDQFTATQAQLDLLQKMSEEQNSRVQTLQSRLQPLSPSGSIPGLDTSYFGNAHLGEPGAYDLDLDSFVQGDDYFPHTAPNGPSEATPGDFKLPDLNYELPDAPDLNGAGFFEGTGAGGFDGTHDGGLGAEANGDGEGGRVESVSASSTGTSPSVATVEDVEEEGEGRRTSKRTKRK
ncbi:hypothetical protein P154DRAFT_519274 [Amniculicola lignicola CBS 123094]|uniref:Uncharacterized protein n=1 Tax=Amniculicola lignicola CBS 123094 TaxID=1392246 RepID=A0A6A5X1T1_9PLEO|nr:hypothetical protein P154DRAFT_519274 [Amniculicola lignicola CBS 123094]